MLFGLCVLTMRVVSIDIGLHDMFKMLYQHMRLLISCFESLI
jgi:hypothetical protein